MKRSRLQRTEIEIDKCVICELDLPLIWKSKLYWYYIKEAEKDLDKAIKWLILQLQTEDNKQTKREIWEFKNENNI